MILGHPISIGFRRLTGCQRDPRDRGVTGPSRFDPTVHISSAFLNASNDYIFYPTVDFKSEALSNDSE